MIDFEWTDHQQSLYRSIVDFVREHFNPGIEDRDQNEIFDRTLWTKFFSADFFSVENLLKNARDTVVSLEALGFGSEDGGLNFAIAAHLLACVRPLMDFGYEQQKEIWFDKICNGSIIITNAMTEASSGSDAFDMETVAQPTSFGYVLNGVKTYCSNGPSSDLIMVYAKTEDSGQGSAKCTCFLVPSDRKGVICGPPEHKLGLRTCPMGSISFKNVAVKEDEVIGGLGGGMAVFNRSMIWERTCLSALHIGALDRLLKKTVDFCKQRKSGGKVLGQHQAIAHKLAAIKIDMEAARSLMYRTAWALDNKKSSMLMSSANKVFVSQVYQNSMLRLKQVWGGQAFRGRHDLERNLRDSMAGTIYSGTTEIQYNIISRLLGL